LFYKIAENLIIDHYRQNKKNTVSTEDILELADGEDQIDKTDSILLKEKMAAALDCLSEDNKQIITLKYIDGLSSKEISTVTGKSVVNVNVIVHRCLKQLKNNLNEEN
jgi:RNA polymerase sigma-70 factor (ECF subfamily)